MPDNKKSTINKLNTAPFKAEASTTSTVKPVIDLNIAVTPEQKKLVAKNKRQRELEDKPQSWDVKKDYIGLGINEPGLQESISPIDFIIPNPGQIKAAANLVKSTAKTLPKTAAKASKYLEVSKPTTGTLPPPQQAGFINLKGALQKYPKGKLTQKEIDAFKNSDYYKQTTKEHLELKTKFGDSWTLPNFAEENLQNAIKTGNRNTINKILYGGRNWGASDYVIAGLAGTAYPGYAGIMGLAFSPPAVKNKVLNKAGITSTPGVLSSRDTTINITNRPMDFAKVNQTANGQMILGGEFIEGTNNTVRKAKDWLTAIDTYSDKEYSSKDIQSFYGIENGKFKVGKASDFKSNTEIVPRRFGATNISQAILNEGTMRLLDKEGNPIYQNTPNTGKFILYSPSTKEAEFNYITSGKSGVDKVNKFLKKNKDAQYIHLDNGRYEFYGLNPEGLSDQDFRDYYQQDLEREGNPGYNIILKSKGGLIKKYQEGGKVTKFGLSDKFNEIFKSEYSKGGYNLDKKASKLKDSFKPKFHTVDKNVPKSKSTDFEMYMRNYQHGGRLIPTSDRPIFDLKYGDGGKIKKFDPLEEKEFLKEYSKYSKLTGMSSNPDDLEHYYDYRALWKDTGTILYNLDKDQHLPSKYKTLGHPNKYIQGIDTTKEKYAKGGEAPPNNNRTYKEVQTEINSKLKEKKLRQERIQTAIDHIKQDPERFNKLKSFVDTKVKGTTEPIRYCIGSACYSLTEAEEILSYTSGTKLQDDIVSGKLKGYNYDYNLNNIEKGDILQLNRTTKTGKKGAPYHNMLIENVIKDNSGKVKNLTYFGSRGDVESFNSHDLDSNWINNTINDKKFQIIKKEFIPNSLLKERNRLKPAESNIVRKDIDYVPNEYINYLGGSDESDEKKKNRQDYIKAMMSKKQELMKAYNISNNEFNDLVKVSAGILDQESEFGTSTRYNLKQIPGTQFAAKILKGNFSEAFDSGQYSEGAGQIKEDYFPKKAGAKFGISPESKEATLLTILDRYTTQVPSSLKGRPAAYLKTVNVYKGMKNDNNEYAQSVLNKSSDYGLPNYSAAKQDNKNYKEEKANKQAEIMRNAFGVNLDGTISNNYKPIGIFKNPIPIKKAKGGKVTFTTDNEKHIVYKKESPTGMGKGKEGHIMVNHPTKDKGKWDTIDLTEKANAKTVAQGVAATKKWHKENPMKSYAMGGETNKYVAEPSTTATKFKKDKPIFRSESPRQIEPMFNANNWILQHMEPFSSIKDAYGVYDAIKRGDKADLNKSIFSQIIPFVNYSDIELPKQVKEAVNRSEQENKDIILKRIKKSNGGWLDKI